MKKSVVKNKRLINNKRIKVFYAGFTLILFVIIGRLAYMQIFDGQTYYDLAVKQAISGTKVEKSSRGSIFDSSEKLLATDIPAKTIYAVPKDIENKEEVAKTIAPILEIETSKILEMFEKNKNFVYIKRQVEKEVAQKLKETQVKGIYYTDTQKRFYPQKTLASTILGFLNVDGKGAAGIENYLNKELTGVDGKAITEEDVFNKTKISTNPSTDGNSLYLTIDAVPQSIAEARLKQVVEETKAKSATFLLMDPNTGAIITMAEAPGYDNNNYDKYEPYMWLNNSVNLAYEPGSVFKTLTATIALNEKLVYPSEVFNDKGYIEVANGKSTRIMKNYHGKAYGNVTFTQAIGYSSNVVSVKVGQRIPLDKYMEYLGKFGIGKKTGIELPAESAGLLQSKSEIEKPIVHSNMFIGQGVSVTPLQMVRMVSQIINGGHEIQPHIIDKIVDENNNIIKDNKDISNNGQQLIATETSAQMCEIMRQETIVGTGKNAQVEGYDIGGKTGTAQVADEHGYSDTKYIVSFVGAVPMDKPQFVGLIVINEPSSTSSSGGITAAPVWKDIMSEILKYYNVAPTIQNPSVDLTQ